MVTLDKMDYGNTTRLFLSGLSTDQKPTEKVEGVYLTQNSVFKEIDTSAIYLFDKENKRWVKQTSNNSGAGSEISGETIDLGDRELATEQDIRDLWK